VALKLHPFSFAKLAGPATGLQAITSDALIPFQPKAFLFWASGATALGTFTNPRLFSYGWAMAPGTGSYNTTGFQAAKDNYCFANWSQIAPAFPTSMGWYSEEKCIGFASPMTGFFDIPGWDALAHISSVDALGSGLYGLTLNWTHNTIPPPGTPVPSPARVINCVAFGGDDIELRLYNWTVNPNTGTHTSPGLGMRSDVALHLGGIQAPIESPVSVHPVFHTNFGAFNCQGQQCMVATDSSHFGVNGFTTRKHSTDYFASVLQAEQDCSNSSFEEMTDDGWTYSTVQNVAGALGLRYISLAMRGVGSAIGKFTKPAGGPTASQVVPTPNILGVGMFFLGDHNIATGAMDTCDRVALGVASGGRLRAAAAVASAAASGMTSGTTWADRAYAVVNNDTPAVQSAITSVTFSSGQADVTWGVSDTEASEQCFLALGAGGGGTCEGGGAPSSPPSLGTVPCAPVNPCPQECR
jgi:hypothetical protein